jgi:hypothetical protein
VAETVEVLVLDLLEWLLRRPRSYEETMDAWRTSCPNLTVWEEANARGLVAVEQSGVGVTASGVALLERTRPERS